MKKNLSLQDYQLISAYLDNACSPKERALFEKRLAVEPELLQALQEFKQTRRLLRVMPVRRAPRNFTLSPSQVPAKPQRFFLVPAMNILATTAAVLIVVVYAGSHLMPGFLEKRSAAESASPMALSAASTSSQSESATPMIITWGQSGTGVDSSTKGGLGGGGGQSENNTFSTSKVVPGILLGGGSGSATSEAPTESIAGASQPAATADTSSLILGIPDKADQGKVISTPEVATENLPASGPDFQLIEIGLGALAIISFVVAWILRRARG